MSLSLWTVACGTIQPKQSAGARFRAPDSDASAIHGRPGAQVALLQSPVPRVAVPVKQNADRLSPMSLPPAANLI